MKVLQCNWKVFLCILKYKNGTKRETKRIKTRRSQKEKQKDKREKKKKKKENKRKENKKLINFQAYTTPHISHSTFYVVAGCMEHSGAQVFIGIAWIWC
jgi:hypothetical protein